MNGLEKCYADYLELLARAEEIVGAEFEPEKLRIGLDHLTTYTPDFRVVRNDGTIEFHEVKGNWEDDARVKIKVAARVHPYVFRAVTRRTKAAGGGWQYECFTPNAPVWPP